MFSMFSDRDVMILYHWANNTNYFDLADDVMLWTEDEKVENGDFIDDAHYLELQILDEVLNRFVPCVMGYHQFNMGLLDSSVCTKCNTDIKTMLTKLPHEVDVKY